MTAQEDRELYPWLVRANLMGGQFLKSLTDAGLRADPMNYQILRPALLMFRDKFRNYYDEEVARMTADGAWPMPQTFGALVFRASWKLEPFVEEQE